MTRQTPSAVSRLTIALAGPLPELEHAFPTNWRGMQLPFLGQRLRTPSPVHESVRMGTSVEVATVRRRTPAAGASATTRTTRRH